MQVTAMAQTTGAQQIYTCPMHTKVRKDGPGKCSECGMDLLSEGTRFGLLRHMLSSPLHITIMATLMLAAMAAAMWFVH
jgi:hypothetical protein